MNARLTKRRDSDIVPYQFQSRALQLLAHPAGLVRGNAVNARVPESPRFGGGVDGPNVDAKPCRFGVLDKLARERAICSDIQAIQSGGARLLHDFRWRRRPSIAGKAALELNNPANLQGRELR